MNVRPLELRSPSSFTPENPPYLFTPRACGHLPDPPPTAATTPQLSTACYFSLSLCSSLSAQRPSKWPRTKELLDEAARHCNSDRMAFSALVISRPPPLLATAISVRLSNFGPMIVLFQKKTWPPDPHKMAPAKDFSVAAASNKCLPQDSVPRDHRRLTLNIRLLSEFCCASAVPSNFSVRTATDGQVVEK